MKLLRYLVNTILFVVIWCIPAFLFVGYSLSVNGTRPSGIAGAGGIIAIIISYRLVKKINASNLWASLFDETETLEKEEKTSNIVEEKKVQVVKEKTNKKVEEEDSNISNPITNFEKRTFIVLAIFLLISIFGAIYFSNKDEPVLKKEKSYSESYNEKLKESRNKIDLLTKDKLYSARAYTVRASNIYFDNSLNDKDYKINAVIEEIEKAIMLEPSNFHLYLTRAQHLRRKAGYCRVGETKPDNIYLKKALIDVDIALSLHPNGQAYTWEQEHCQEDSDCELAAIYIDRMVIKKSLGLEYCSDLKKACELDISLSNSCRGQNKEDENCF